MKISKEQLEQVVPELKKKYGDDIHLITADGDQVIARVPSGEEYQRFLDMAADDRKKTHALDSLSRSCILFPAAAELDQLLAKRPGLTTSFGAKLTELAGAVEDVEAKKL